MAFRTEVLRAVGGFDPATGAGTPARGGDDLYGFVRVLAQGHRLRYTPYALVWHHHRETWADLETQAYGYGAGLTAYLTAILAGRPALLPAFLARLPRGLAHARTLTRARDTDGGDGGAPGRTAPARTLAAPAVAAAAPGHAVRAARLSAGPAGGGEAEGMRTAVPVLLYHAVMDDPPDWIAEFTVTPREFATQLDAVVDSGRTPSPSAPSPAGLRCRPGRCCSRSTTASPTCPAPPPRPWRSARCPPPRI
ncbi:hypothetical protein SHKM778_07550 [Streptomyces sp. KM77-8]|uniref:Uncharacterized protein n=1 Tax=Streptomyces haneummycinicus TaxID=3074435 RepID=A0AAT9HAD0_9ACTN